MLYLGIDGGGTKTEATLCDETGHILAWAMEGSTAPSSNSPEKLRETLKSLFNDLRLSDRGDQMILGYAGISGCASSWEREKFIECLSAISMTNIHMQVGSDIICALNAEIGPAIEGAVMIIGTGSVVFSRVDGKCSRIGGWGYLVGDEGSGYDMGRRALNAAFRYEDGRSPKTLLTEIIEKQGGASIRQIAEEIDKGGRTAVAAYARTLIKGAELGDSVALEQFHICIEELQLMIRTAYREMNCETMPIVLAGGIAQNSEFLWDRLQQGMNNVKLVRLSKPPVYGAVLEAVGYIPEGFSKRYMTEYQDLKNRNNKCFKST